MSATTELIEKWLEAKKDLAKAKKLELALRAEILDGAFAEKSGTLNTYHQGFMIKGNFGINYKLDGVAFDDAFANGEISESVAAVVDYKPTLNKTAYKELTGEQSAELDDFITTAPALPTLTIKVDPEW